VLTRQRALDQQGIAVGRWRGDVFVGIHSLQEVAAKYN
jgi:hypothetical protein